MISPCPSPWCLWSMQTATICLAIGWLLWAPLTIAGKPIPRPVRWAAWARGGLAVVLVLVVGTWTCRECQ